MAGWIKFDKDMATDPRLVRAASHLMGRYQISHAGLSADLAMSNSDASRFLCNALRGALVTLWCYADCHICDDDTLQCDAKDIDALVGIDGFCELLPSDWIELLPNGGIKLPGYCDKNNLISKKKRRARGAERTRRYRERLRADRDAPRDAPRDASHGRHTFVTNGEDQDQDLDLDNKNKNAHRSGARVPSRHIDLIFAHWQKVHDKPQARCTEKRRRKIAVALKAYSLDDLRAAIDGYRLSRWHRGENPSGMVYDDLELMLRDSEHIERGMEFAKKPPVPYRPGMTLEAAKRICVREGRTRMKSETDEEFIARMARLA